MRTSFGVVIASAAMVAAPVAAQQTNPSWNGFYAGLNAGGLFGNTSVPPNGGLGGLSGNGGGFSGGAQAGYNYLLGPVLLGTELDFQGSTYAASLNGGPFGGSVTERMPWFSTMRLRAGYTIGSVMPYVTGGAVWGQRTIDGPFANSANFWTWTVGGGVEGFLADRWSTKLEYLYMGTPSVPVAGPGATSNGNLIRLGVNYHF